MQLEVLEGRQLLATITVNTTADDTAADATLSLREAIEVSNGTLAVSSLSTQEQAQVSGAVGATNTIGFHIPTTDPGYNAAAGVWTIAVHSALPTISTHAAIINGYSQPGSSENTLAQGDNAKLTIAIDGAGLPD
jgi:CSLREA domain-containing protein